MNKVEGFSKYENWAIITIKECFTPNALPFLSTYRPQGDRYCLPCHAILCFLNLPCDKFCSY